MSVGATLRQAREAKGLSLEDIKNSTQIMTRQLQEMEHDDFSSFAAPIYAKGFIRLFARAVGIDPDVVRGWQACEIPSDGSMGCAVAHYSLVRYAEAAGLPWLVVFEDDAVPCDDAAEALVRAF